MSHTRYGCHQSACLDFIQDGLTRGVKLGQAREGRPNMWRTSSSCSPACAPIVSTGESFAFPRMSRYRTTTAKLLSVLDIRHNCWCQVGRSFDCMRWCGASNFSRSRQFRAFNTNYQHYFLRLVAKAFTFLMKTLADHYHSLKASGKREFLKEEDNLEMSYDCILR